MCAHCSHQKGLKISLALCSNQHLTKPSTSITNSVSMRMLQITFLMIHLRYIIILQAIVIQSRTNTRNYKLKGNNNHLEFYFYFPQPHYVTTRASPIHSSVHTLLKLWSPPLTHNNYQFGLHSWNFNDRVQISQKKNRQAL